MNEQEPQYFTKFKVGLYDKLDKRFDAHAGQIAYISEKVTVIEEDIRVIKADILVIKADIIEIKEDILVIKDEIVSINEKLDTHSEQITGVISTLNRKADVSYVDDVNSRTKKLEKVALA